MPTLALDIKPGLDNLSLPVTADEQLGEGLLTLRQLQHKHWWTHERPPTSVHVAVGVFILLVGILAIVGNTLVIVTFIK